MNRGRRPFVWKPGPALLDGRATLEALAADLLTKAPRPLTAWQVRDMVGTARGRGPAAIGTVSRVLSGLVRDGRAEVTFVAVVSVAGAHRSVPAYVVARRAK